MSKSSIRVRYSLNSGAIVKIAAANKELRIFKAKQAATKHNTSTRVAISNWALDICKSLVTF